MRAYNLRKVIARTSINVLTSGKFMKLITSLSRAIAALIVLGSVALPAHALVFQYSFTNTVGNVSGTVTGKIYGLSDNAKGAASEVTIETFPSGLNSVYGTGPIFTSLWSNPAVEDAFTVLNGTITFAQFLAQDTVNGLLGASQLTLNYAGAYNSIIINGGSRPLPIFQNNDGLSGVSFAAVADGNAVPEPASIALMGLGLLGFAASRRKSTK